MSQVDDWSDGYTSDYLRDLNTYGPASANVPRPQTSVVSRQVQYVSPVAQTEARTNDTPMYSGGRQDLWNIPARSQGQAGQDSGWQGGRRSKRQASSSSRGSSRKRTGVVRQSAPVTGTDVTDSVIKSVKAGGNNTFANWRQTLIDQGWDENDAKSVRYDPTTGKFMAGNVSAAMLADYPEIDKIYGAGNTDAGSSVPAKTDTQTPAADTGSSAPAPAAENTDKTAADNLSDAASAGQPAPASGVQPAPASAGQPAPASAGQPAPASGAQSDAEIEQLRAQIRAEVNKLRGFGDFGNNAIALAQQWGDTILSDSGKSDAEQMQEMIKHLQWWNSIAPGIVKMNGGN